MVVMVLVLVMLLTVLSPFWGTSWLLTNVFCQIRTSHCGNTELSNVWVKFSNCSSPESALIYFCIYCIIKYILIYIYYIIIYMIYIYFHIFFKLLIFWKCTYIFCNSVISYQHQSTTLGSQSPKNQFHSNPHMDHPREKRLTMLLNFFVVTTRSN